LGLDNAGKTTVVKRICGEPQSEIDRIEPTLGFRIQTLRYNDQYDVHLWDVGGQKTIRAYWRNYFEKTDGLIWVVDSADRVRLELCKRELHALLKEERLAGASLLIFANKQDVDGSMSAEEISKVLELNAGNDDEDGGAGAGGGVLGKHRHWKILECSAAKGPTVTNGGADGEDTNDTSSSKGLLEGMDWIVQDIADRIFMLD